MKNENNQIEVVELQKTELEILAASLPVRTKLRAGRLPVACSRCNN